jgi:hypothetical protein
MVNLNNPTLLDIDPYATVQDGDITQIRTRRKRIANTQGITIYDPNETVLDGDPYATVEDLPPQQQKVSINNSSYPTIIPVLQSSNRDDITYLDVPKPNRIANLFGQIKDSFSNLANQTGKWISYSNSFADPFNAHIINPYGNPLDVDTDISTRTVLPQIIYSEGNISLRRKRNLAPIEDPWKDNQRIPSKVANIAAIEQPLDPDNLTNPIQSPITNTSGQVIENPNLINDPHRQGVTSEEINLQQYNQTLKTPNQILQEVGYSEPEAKEILNNPDPIKVNEPVNNPDPIKVNEPVNNPDPIKVNESQTSPRGMRERIGDRVEQLKTGTQEKMSQVAENVRLPKGKIGRIASLAGLGAVGTGVAAGGIWAATPDENKPDMANNLPYSIFNSPEAQARMEMKKQEAMLRKYYPTPEEAANLSLKIAKQKADLEQGYRQTERMRQLSAQLMQDRVSNYIQSMANSQGLTSYLITSTLNV